MIETLNSTGMWPIKPKKGRSWHRGKGQPDKVIGDYQPMMGEKMIGRSLPTQILVRERPVNGRVHQSKKASEGEAHT
jgi:hypothetical protein